MIFIVNAENRSLFESDLRQMHRQRKAVFVDDAGWNVPVIGDLEIDRYDRDDTTYLIAKATPDSAQVLASARLLPTTKPHLMSEVFPYICRRPVPRGPTIWEVSRFCVNRRTHSRRVRLALLWEIICAVMETALLYGVEQVTYVANSAVLPLTLDCGWRATPLGPTVPDGDDEATALVAAITPEALRRARSRFGVASPVTRFLVPAMSIAA